MRVSPTIIVVATCGAWILAGCDDGHQTDGDADTDTDADADSDAEEPDSDADEPDEYWTFTELRFPRELDGDYQNVRIAARADDDVVLCSASWEGRGGVGRFDGTSLVVESTEILCTQVVALGEPDQVWVIAHDGELNHNQVHRRVGTTWQLETVADAESCAYEALFQRPSGAPALVGLCGEERRAWSHDGTSWVVDAAVSLPAAATLDKILGATALGDAATVYFGEGASSGSPLFVDSGTVADVAESMVLWAGGSIDELLALDRGALRAHSSTGWSEVVACPDAIPSPEENECWRTVASASEGAVLYLGGGRGSWGDWGIDDRRLHRWDGVELTRILEPCGGEPHCSIAAVDVTDNNLFVASRREGVSTLLMAPL